jgi:hypothetical protein
MHILKLLLVASTVWSKGRWGNITQAVVSLDQPENLVDGFFSTGGHTNNWAVLVDTSR